MADEIIKNTYKVLMTRGQKGCYVYCCDRELAEYIKGRIEREGSFYNMINIKVFSVAEEKF